MLIKHVKIKVVREELATCQYLLHFFPNTLCNSLVPSITRSVERKTAMESELVLLSAPLLLQVCLSAVTHLAVTATVGCRTVRRYSKQTRSLEAQSVNVPRLSLEMNVTVRQDVQQLQPILNSSRRLSNQHCPIRNTSTDNVFYVIECLQIVPTL